MADFAAALRARLIADATVAGVVGTRVHWTLVPQDSALPYIRLQTVSDLRPSDLEGYDGTRETRVQADCFATRHAAARTLAEAVIAAAIAPFTQDGVAFGRIEAEGPRDLGDDTPQGYIHQSSLDLLIWHRLA